MPLNRPAFVVSGTRKFTVGVCRVHFMRNVLAKVSKGQAEMVAAAIRTVFAQPTGRGVRTHVEVVAGMLEQQFPAVAAMLRDAREDLTGLR